MLKSFYQSEQKNRIIQMANAVKQSLPVHITDERAMLSAGGKHDYYSNGDYWWPNPETIDGLPYIQQDGLTNPANFIAHRTALRQMRSAVTCLAQAYRLTGDGQYANCAIRWLKEFFLDEETKMLPHLTYAQALPGICEGRGIGIIDTLHLIDIPTAIEVLSPKMNQEMLQHLKLWFADYLQWMNTHKHGIEERDWPNNHAVTWFAQAASFARFTRNEEILAFCRERYKTVLLPDQMSLDGSFPLELARTKPYNYSCFVLDNMAAICLFASDRQDNLWEFALADGRSLQKGLIFMLPYLKDKHCWPHRRDLEHDDEWPVAMPFMLFCGLYFENQDYLNLWGTLEQYPSEDEIRRNISIRCPYLFLTHEGGLNDELLCR